MKTFPFLALIAAAASLITAASHAEVLASYSNSSAPSDNPIAPIDWSDFVEEPSLFTGAAGSGISKINNQFYTGWSPSVDTSKYVGFTLTPMEGYQVTITDMNFRVRPLDALIQTSFVWGYRIDEGSGFGAWNFGTIWNNDSSDYSSPLAKTWDIPDFATTGTVEFGLFATTPAASDSMEIRTVLVNGATAPAAIPEPSTYALLGITATIALLGFRRRGNLASR